MHVAGKPAAARRVITIPGAWLSRRVWSRGAPSRHALPRLAGCCASSSPLSGWRYLHRAPRATLVSCVTPHEATCARSGHDPARAALRADHRRSPMSARGRGTLKCFRFLFALLGALHRSNTQARGVLSTQLRTGTLSTASLLYATRYADPTDGRQLNGVRALRAAQSRLLQCVVFG